MAELIASGDTLDVGRQAINNFYSGGTNLFSAGTGSNSVKLTSGLNTVNSLFGIVFGKSNSSTAGSYGLINNGTGNTVTTSFATILNGKLNSVGGPANSYGTILNGGSNSVTGLRSLIGNGVLNNVSGSGSLILNGGNNVVSGAQSSIINGQNNNIAIAGTSSTIINGILNNVSGSGSEYGLIGGGSLNQITSSNYSTILNGSSNIASGVFSTVIGGSNNTASGAFSVVWGNGNTASHTNSVAIGAGAATDANNTMVFASVAGNNTIKFNFATGNGYFDGVADLANADYAENFCWDDNNENDENRYGLAVSFTTNGKIKIGGTDILGIVSPNPGIVGDGAELNWKHKYEIDEWGFKKIIIYKTFIDKKTKKNIFIDENNYFFVQDKNGIFTQIEIPETFVDGETKTEIIEVPKINKNFKSSEYIPRSKRKEWSAIGLIGKLRIRTAEPITSKYVDINKDGLAINGSKYHVIEQIKNYDKESYGIVKIFFK